MMKDAHDEIESIARALGDSPDFVQGGGGNMSIKIDEHSMLIKASGFALKDVRSGAGVVPVHYQEIRNYFNNNVFGSDAENESLRVIADATVQGSVPLKASIETGFHSFLPKYVIHTHSVYASIVACSQAGDRLLNHLFDKKGINVLWVPYASPGFYLTLGVRKALDGYLTDYGTFPDAIVLQNHGLIVAGDDLERSLNIHTLINDTIKDHFSITDPYPVIALDQMDTTSYISHTPYICALLKGLDKNANPFANVLFPDQIVYLNHSFGTERSKMSIRYDTGEIVYNTNQKEARTIEETLLAYMYIMAHMQQYGLVVNTLRQADVDYINAMESEKYRQQLLK